MTEPAIRARLRAAMLEAMLPPWAPSAACAEKAPNNAPWDSMFDDPPHRRDGEYEWSTKTLHAIGICTSCPVRLECLTYAVESERRHEQDYWASELEMVTDGRLYGVFGGVPGRIRERYRNDPDPIASCDTWYTQRFGTSLDTRAILSL